MKALELKIPPLAWVIASALCMWASAKWLPSFAFHLNHSIIVAALLAISGLSIAISGLVTFQRAATTVNPMMPGRASSLVTGGPYRFTRNPMYLGMLLILLGWFFALQNLAALPFVGCYVLLITELQIQPEEQALAQLFGEEYADYTNTVSRWFGTQRPT